MDKILVTAVLIIGGVAAALVVVTGLGTSASIGSQSAAESQRADAVRTETSIEVIAAASNPAGTQIDVWVKNVGVAPVSAVNKSDVFVITPGSRFDAMTHAASGDNTWIEDPLGSAWNRGDTLHLTITLPAGNPLALGDHLLAFSTANGVSAEHLFTR